MKNSKNSSRHLTRDVLRHVSTYGLTTAEAATRVLFGGHHGRASSQLRAMVATGELHRHGTLFTTDNKPLRWKDMLVKYAVLAFCCLGKQQRPLLLPEQVNQLTRRVTEKVGLPPVRESNCYMHSTRRIALIRVYPKRRPTSDFERALALRRLQEFVHFESFKPWVYFAMNGQLIITYLLPAGPHVRELTTWLARKPLVSRLVEPAVVIPTEVHTGARVPGWSRPR